MADKDYKPIVHRYRPKRLGQVIGQESAVKIIRGMIKEKKIPATILLSGPYGVGKTTLARIIARYANCQDKNGADECKGCDSCVAFKSERHPDIHEINSGDMRGIDNVRDLKKVAGLSPRFNKRIYILDECQAMTADAWRAALKIIEEPPPRTLFILSSNEKQKFPATILSRCFDIELDEISETTLAKYIRYVSEKEGSELPKEACLKIAKASNGHARNAMQLLEQVLLYIAADKDVEKATSDLPSIVQKVLGLPPDKLIVAYITAVIKGDAANAITLLNHVQNAAYFMGLTVTFIRQYILFKVAPKKMEPRYYRIVNANKEGLDKWAFKDLVNLLDIYLRSFERMKQYVVPERELMELATYSGMTPILKKRIEE